MADYRNTGVRVAVVGLLSVVAITFSPPRQDSQAGHTPRLTCFHREATIRGSANGDIIIGTDRTNIIRAGKGRDGVFGGGGKDYLCGNKGDDTLSGGDGKDFLNGGPGIDTCHGEVRKNCERGHN